MLRPLQIGLHRPISYPVDPNAVFQPGMVGQFNKVGNEVVLGVSDGIAPFGILDDARDIAFTRPIVDEIILVEVADIVDDGYGVLVTAIELTKLLDNSNILEQSWRADVEGIVLVPMNGAIIIPAGTPLNSTADSASLTLDAIEITANYAYHVPNQPGVDTTMGSGMVTVWVGRGLIFSTDQFDTESPFAINAPLYVSASGKFTTRQLDEGQPAVGMVIVPPTSVNAWLEFVWG
jgi:hypothetical protein